MIHRCADVSEPRERHPNEAARANARYWADPEKFRAAARAQYARNRKRYAAAARVRMARLYERKRAAA